MRTPGFVFAFMLSMPMMGHAASFDCAKARTPVEKMICADRALSTLDEQISDRYRQVFDRLEPRFRPKLLDSQRRWLKGRIASPELKAVLAARLDDLKSAIISVNGLTFLRLSGTGRPPYLINALPGAQAYNQWVDQVFSDAESDDGDVVQWKTCDAQAAQGKFDDSCDGLNQTNRSYQIDFASPDLISVHQSLSVSGWHTAHPANEDTHANWWLGKPGQVTREQIFADQRYVGVIRQAVKESFDFDIDIRGMGDVLHPSLDPRMWGLTTTGLSITCQGYDVGNGRGSATMEIPWANFGGSVNPALVKMLAKVAPITDRRLKMAGD